MDRNKHNLHVYWRKFGTLCLLILLSLPINTHSLKYPHLSLIEQNSSEGTLFAAAGGVEVGVAEEQASRRGLLGDCGKLLQLANGHVNMTLGEGGRRTLHFFCQSGHRLLGPPKLLCPPDQWQRATPPPYCERTGCEKLPLIMNGGERVSGVGLGEEGAELYSEGVVVEYECESGFRLVPVTSQHRVCRQGQWTGSSVACVFDGCARFDHPDNGYIEEPDQLILPAGDYGHVRPGAKVLFKCNEGYTLIGPSLSVCQPTGQWQPASQPVCRQTTPTLPTRCLPPSPVIQMFSESGEKVDEAEEGAVVQMGCALGYRDKTHGCMQLHWMRCGRGGQWQGSRMPQCIRAQDCVFPPKVLHAHIQQIQGGVGEGRFGLGAQVTYACVNGYQLMTGEPATLTCGIGGCWQPSRLPYCQPIGGSGGGGVYVGANSDQQTTSNWPAQYFGNTANTSLLFSIVTALSIVFVLMSVCVAVVCRQRPPHSSSSSSSHHPHHSSPSAPSATSSLYRAASALHPTPASHDPDRVALIAFADGIQSGLPTYEEAMRSSSSGGARLSYRSGGPPYQGLGWAGRRGGGAAAADDVISDTSGTCSTGTGVLTLDTVSCHSSSCSSGNQTAASCRAICGSLASFDTLSMHNTEGVPLLEESELEESGLAMLGGGLMEGGSTPPACDNTSFKLQSDIDSIHS